MLLQTQQTNFHLNINPSFNCVRPWLNWLTMSTASNGIFFLVIKDVGPEIKSIM